MPRVGNILHIYRPLTQTKKEKHSKFAGETKMRYASTVIMKNGIFLKMFALRTMKILLMTLSELWRNISRKDLSSQYF